MPTIVAKIKFTRAESFLRLQRSGIKHGGNKIIQVLLKANRALSKIKLEPVAAKCNIDVSFLPNYHDGKSFQFTKLLSYFQVRLLFSLIS